jgi:hypothetical protein
MGKRVERKIWWSCACEHSSRKNSFGGFDSSFFGGDNAVAWTRVTHLLSKCCTAWARSPSYFSLVIFQTGFCAFVQGQVWTMILILYLLSIWTYRNAHHTWLVLWDRVLLFCLYCCLFVSFGLGWPKIMTFLSLSPRYLGLQGYTTIQLACSLK